MAEPTNPDAGVAQESLSEVGVESSLEALFGDTPEAPKAPAKAEEAPQESPEELSDELTPDDLVEEVEAQSEQSDGDEFEIVHAGQQHKLPRSEVIKLAQQGFDYTQKTQAVAAKDREVSERLQRIAQLEQVQPHLDNSRAQVAALAAQLQQYANVDWVQLATNDPLEYPRHRAQYDTLNQAYQQAYGQYQQQTEVVQQERTRINTQILEQEARRLPELVPAWKDPAKFEASKKDMQAYLHARGADVSQVGRYLDNAVAMAVLYDAAEMWKLRQGKAAKVNQVRKAPPVVKPGAPLNVPQHSHKQATQALRKMGQQGRTKGQEQLLEKMLNSTFKL
jgi:hypothetical protein